MTALPETHVGQPVNPRCCAKCASKPGSPERSDSWHWCFLQEAWSDGEPFYCHESVPDHPEEVVDGRPRWRLCAAWAAMHAKSKEAA